MNLSSPRNVAHAFLISEKALWGLFPVVTIFSINHVSPFISVGVSSLVAAGVFAAMMTFKSAWKELLIKKAWLDMLGATIIIGIIFYTLTFVALQYTSAGNQAILFLTEIAFGFLIFGPILRAEPITKNKVLGATLMCIGAIAILFQNTTAFNIGDLMVICSAATVNFGYFFAKRAMKFVSSITLMFVRSIISGVVLILVALLIGNSFEGLSNSWSFLLINGIFLLGISKLMLLEAIKRVDVSHAVNFSPLSVAFTLFFAYLFLQEVPNWFQVMGLIPITIGVYVLTKPSKE